MKNIRDMVVTTSTGKDVKDTSMLAGEAEQTKAERESNETVQLSTPKTSMGPLGGMNTGS